MSASKKVLAAQALNAEADSQRFQVDRLQQRVLDLEGRIVEGSGLRPTSASTFRECAACQHRIDKEAEINPNLRDLQEKFTKYHFKLIQVRNENLCLKRDLSVAKKVMCQEMGIDNAKFQRLLKHGVEDGWRGPRENLPALRQKNQELESKLKEMNVKPPPKPSLPEVGAKKKVSEEKKPIWKTELEKRKGNDVFEKERTDLAAENTEFRKKLNQSKNHIRELTNENDKLRHECFNFAEKCRQDTNITKSLKNAEDQLKVALEERSEMRRELMAERTRNKTMKDNVEVMRNQLGVINESSALDKRIIDNLTTHKQRLQNNLDDQNFESSQITERLMQEMKRMVANHQTDQEMLKKMQDAIAKKNEIVRELQGKLFDLTNFYSEKARLAAEKKKREEEEDEEGEDEEDEDEDEDEPETPTARQLLKMDLSRYKTLYETIKDESESMSKMIADLNFKMNELGANLIMSQEKYLCNERDRRELQEKVKRLEGTIAEKKKNVKAWDYPKSKFAVPARTKMDELNIKYEVLMEENNFLRSFLSNTISSKEDDFQLYRILAENAEAQYETSIQVIKSELTIVNEEVEEEVEEEGEGEENEKEKVVEEEGAEPTE